MSAWTRSVKNAAESIWGDEPPLTGEVAVTISYFYGGKSLDVDNVPKPVLDALKGLVYLDDRQVSDLLCRKRRLRGYVHILAPSSLLMETRARLREFLHVSVAQSLISGVTE